MSDEILSQAEVESLLNAVESKPGGRSAQATQTGPEGTKPPREKVIPYDFKRPERVGKEQMRALQSLHEGFGRNYGAALSGLLRTVVEVKLTSVDQLTYSEFVFSLENPTCFNLLTAKPLEGNLILDINPSILYPIINRLLGGGKEDAVATRRPLTEIELRLVGRITDLFLTELKEAWKLILTLELHVDRVESNPQLVQIVPPNEVVILISFELILGDIRGMMNLCIPFNAIERISDRLTTNNWVSYGTASPTEESKRQVSSRLEQSLVSVVATLAKTRISTSDMLSLRVGDIVTTEKDMHTPLEVSVEDAVKFHARPGAIKGHKAIQIENRLDRDR
ncbi:MAG: flagellar motor switch protein FliM [Planctomycetota bacterium]